VCICVGGCMEEGNGGGLEGEVCVYVLGGVIVTCTLWAYSNAAHGVDAGD
jgi:hypothetical protein